MQRNSDRPMRTRIAGYTDLTVQEFTTHYKALLDKCIHRGDSYVLSDETGACEMALEYLASHDVPNASITIYRSTIRSSARPAMICSLEGYQIVTVEGDDTERYEAMLDASDDKIIWLRDDDDFNGKGRISGGQALRLMFTGPREAERVESARSVKACMAYYDTIA